MRSLCVRSASLILTRYWGFVGKQREAAKLCAGVGRKAPLPCHGLFAAFGAAQPQGDSPAAASDLSRENEKTLWSAALRRRVSLRRGHERKRGVFLAKSRWQSG